ncbi:hypothetical protein [Krasilnikovia sp. MM14-A1004]|uniref:hypothetical protein n=1 Tax=Krasilnikovia sp. MM14-A1004 TaxID=3373541 RepID=UPI00399D0C8B
MRKRLSAVLVAAAAAAGVIVAGPASLHVSDRRPVQHDAVAQQRAVPGNAPSTDAVYHDM